MDASISLEPWVCAFETPHAATIAGWVSSDRELLALAPLTCPPLTATKVLSWYAEAEEALVALSPAGEPIAYGELNQMPLTERQRWIGHLVVAPEWRGRGVGRRFVQALLDRAFVKHAADAVLLVVFPWNTNAIRCYRRLGFEDCGLQLRTFFGNAQAHELLEMKLTRRFYLAHTRPDARPIRPDGRAA